MGTAGTSTSKTASGIPFNLPMVTTCNCDKTLHGLPAAARRRPAAHTPQVPSPCVCTLPCSSTASYAPCVTTSCNKPQRNGPRTTASGRLLTGDVHAPYPPVYRHCMRASRRTSYHVARLQTCTCPSTVRTCNRPKVWIGMTVSAVLYNEVNDWAGGRASVLDSKGRAISKSLCCISTVSIHRACINTDAYGASYGCAA